MLRKLLLTTMACLFVSASALAQTGVLTGTVTDAESGETLPGANVYIAATQQGDNTDANGEFRIEDIASGEYSIRVTFVGYDTYEESVQIGSGETEVNVALEAGSVGLDQLVVTGYGTTPQREVTGSISTVNSDEFEDVPVQNTEGILQGRAAGVTVSTTSGNPGGGFNVNIRGQGSINASSQPLYIVDGVQMSFDNQSGLTDRSPLNAINPKDIESLEVLKDAAAAAIYGSQAANGVVLITTKSGSTQGPTQVSVSVERGVRSLANEIDFMNTEDWYNYSIESLQNNPSFGVPTRDAAVGLFNSSFLPGYGYSPDATLQDLQNRGTDWIDFATDEGVSQKYDLSVSGGDETTSFYVSGRYEDTEGTVLDNTFRNYNLRTNLNHQVNSRLNTRVKVNVSSEEQVGVCQDGNFVNCPVSAAYFEPPITFPFLENGDYNPNTAFGLGNNIAVLENEVERTIDVFSLIGSVASTYNVTDWFDIVGRAGMDYRSTDDKRFDSIIAASADNGSVSELNRKTSNFNADISGQFAQTFAEQHNVSGLVGAEYRRVKAQLIGGTGIGLPVGFSEIAAAAIPDAVSGSSTEYRRAGYFASAKYNFDERYYIALTGRYDGSSRFGAEDRWGFFPSVSGSWRISSEDWFESSFINELKLRAGYGTTGNSGIGNFSSRQLFGLAGSYAGTRGLAPSQLGNANLTWEEAQELNIGVDFEFFNGRLGGSIDAYTKDNEDLLLDQPIPSDNGFGAITNNVGSVRNEGIELTLSSFNVRTEDFSWQSRLNLSVQRNEVLSLNEGQDQINSGFSNTIKVGQPLGVFNYPDFAGVNPADGRPFWYDQNGDLTYSPVQADNDFKDSGQEDLYGGFGNTLSYKGLQLDVLFQFSYGGTAFDQSAWYFARTANQGGNIYEYVNDRWQEPGDIASVPEAYWGNVYPGTADFRTEPGTHMTDDTGYIRLKSATLGYSLPTSWTEQINLRNIRVYATGINLLTWTQWPGFDPEALGSGNVTAASYPTARQVNVGIEVNF